MKKITAAVFFTILAGCAESSGIVDMGNGTFYASKQAATGFSGLGHLKGDLITQASAYCSRRGQALRVTNTTEARPPFIFGNFPRAEIQFECAEATAPS